MEPLSSYKPLKSAVSRNAQIEEQDKERGKVWLEHALSLRDTARNSLGFLLSLEPAAFFARASYWGMEPLVKVYQWH